MVLRLPRLLLRIDYGHSVAITDALRCHIVPRIIPDGPGCFGQFKTSGATYGPSLLTTVGHGITTVWLRTDQGSPRIAPDRAPGWSATIRSSGVTAALPVIGTAGSVRENNDAGQCNRQCNVIQNCNCGPSAYNCLYFPQSQTDL